MMQMIKATLALAKLMLFGQLRTVCAEILRFRVDEFQYFMKCEF